MALKLDPSTEAGARVARRLREDVVIWLVTVDRDGTPQPSPVWFIWDGQMLLIYSRAGTSRWRNIQRNPRVALNFDGDGRGGNIVVFNGHARIEEAAPAAHANPAYLEKYAQMIARIGLTPEQFSRAYPLPIRIELSSLRGH